MGKGRSEGVRKSKKKKERKLARLGKKKSEGEGHHSLRSVVHLVLLVYL